MVHGVHQICYQGPSSVWTLTTNWDSPFFWGVSRLQAGSLCAVTIKDHFLLSQRPFKAQGLDIKSMNCLWQPMSVFICNIRCTSSQNIDFIDTICLWPFIHDWHNSVPPVPAWPSALCLAFPVLTGLRRPKQTWLQWPGTWPPGVSGSWPLLEMATASSTVWSPPWTPSPPAALVWT